MWRPGHSSGRALRGTRFLPFPGRSALAAGGFIYAAKVRERLLRVRAQGLQGLSCSSRLVWVRRTLDGWLQRRGSREFPSIHTSRTATLAPRGSLLHPLGRCYGRDRAGRGGPSEESFQRPSPFHCMGFLSTESGPRPSLQKRETTVPNIRRKEEGCSWAPSTSVGTHSLASLCPSSLHSSDIYWASR